ncbi:uncharacterized protein LOC114170403 [Vigna unguiculata]|uniref:uncharacterized protein LOC114170403 n=1 Tax=Vigna unguiculata TaxID=3917 RepID=UPI001016FB45|nr:uncharacterized protein LOC114170403 [Vigna unguiculata]
MDGGRLADDQADTREMIRLMQQRMDEMQRNYEAQMQILREENVILRRKEEGVPSTPTVPDPNRLSRVQHREAARVERTQGSRGNPSHTVAESSGANNGGRPSRLPIPASGSSPFTSYILETPLPEKWKMPTFDKYDGTTDPDNHLRVFMHQMMFHAVSDPIWCRVFSTSLTGEALEWFSELPTGCIDSFATLKARFSTQFAPLKPAILTVDNLVNIRQEDGESLRSYLDRYNRMSVKIKGLSDEIARHHFSYGLQPGVFADKISRKKPQTMEEMRERAAKFIQMEDMQEFRVKKREKEDAALTKPPVSRPSKPVTRPTERRVPPPKFTTYTPLAVPRARILQEAFSADSLPAIRKKPPPPDADRSKHCQYHRSIGHTTEECHTLRDKIEELIRQGHLKKYIRQDRPPRSPVRHRSPMRKVLPPRSERKREPEGEKRRREPSRSRRSPRRSRSRSQERPLRGYINTISGGFAGGGSSSAARKRHVRALKSVHLVEKKVRLMPPITFTNDDFKAPDPDHDDPMVISIEVAEYGIGKVLVDQGSSVNILYWKTFQRMNLSEDLIVPYNEQIVGFSGERVDTRGYVDLRTRIGSRKDGREVRVRFLLVEANTSYNVLLGRPCLNAFGAIVSTLHLAMKFPSDKGTICTVHADQQVARQCYAAGLRIRPHSRPRKQHRSEVAMTDLDPGRIRRIGCNQKEKQRRY